MPGCPGLAVLIDAPKVLDTPVSDGAGGVSGVIAVPGTMAGRSGLLAVVDRARCAASAPFPVSFP